MSWTRLRDSSVCVIDHSGAVSVFHIIANWAQCEVFGDKPVEAFVSTLRSFID